MRFLLNIISIIGQLRKDKTWAMIMQIVMTIIELLKRSICLGGFIKRVEHIRWSYHKINYLCQQCGLLTYKNY